MIAHVKGIERRPAPSKSGDWQGPASDIGSGGQMREAIAENWRSSTDVGGAQIEMQVAQRLMRLRLDALQNGRPVAFASRPAPISERKAQAGSPVIS